MFPSTVLQIYFKINWPPPYIKTDLGMYSAMLYSRIELTYDVQNYLYVCIHRRTQLKLMKAKSKTSRSPYIHNNHQ